MVGPQGHVCGIENAGWKGAVTADDAIIDSKRLANVSIVGLPFGSVNFPSLSIWPGSRRTIMI